MKVANIIIVYKDPPQVFRLLEKLCIHPEMHCWIHVDGRLDISIFKNHPIAAKVRFIKDRVAVNWAGFSFVQAMVRSMEEVLASGERYEFINLLSGQDYPIKPIDEFHDFLSDHIGKSFMAWEDVDSMWWKQARHRVTRYHMTDYNFKGKTRLENLLNRILPMRTFYLNFKLYGGPNSSYWTISREAALYLCNYLGGKRRVRWYFKHTWAPDEFLLISLLMNSEHRDRVINNSLRFIDWTRGGARPAILGMEAIERLKNSPKFFARKFDIAKDKVILDMIDAKLLKGEKIEKK